MESFERQTAEGILFTDEYQLTMAQLYYRMGLHEREAQFDHFFRSYPITARTRLVIASMLAWSGCWTG
jgi:nicotinic acid phosphoribosyltransferase